MGKKTIGKIQIVLGILLIIYGLILAGYLFYLEKNDKNTITESLGNSLMRVNPNLNALADMFNTGENSFNSEVKSLNLSNESRMLANLVIGNGLYSNYYYNNYNRQNNINSILLTSIIFILSIILILQGVANISNN